MDKQASHPIMPLISVVLPVHNCEKYIKDAIQSILDQTYTNFELIILSSITSNEESLDIINSFADRRIRHIRGIPQNLPIALNRGIEESKGVYIARMDADDISLPHRFERQVAYMQVHREIGICGTWAKTFGTLEGHIIRHPIDSEIIRSNLLFQTSIVHPTVIMRRSVIREHCLRYDETLVRSEDGDMWYRSSQVTSIANIPEVLLMYRLHENQASSQDRDIQNKFRRILRNKQFKEIGIDMTDSEFFIHQTIASFGSENTPDFLLKSANWLEKIAEGNNIHKIYKPVILQKVLGEKWFIVCYMSARTQGLMAWNIFWKQNLSKWFQKSSRNIFKLLKFLARSLVSRHEEM